MKRITPRWLTHLLQWVPVEAGIYRLNRVKDESKVTVECSDRDERELPQTFVDYEEQPREYMLSAADPAAFRRRKHGAAFARLLQHLRRDRRPRFSRIEAGWRAQSFDYGDDATGLNPREIPPYLRNPLMSEHNAGKLQVDNRDGACQ
jgi:hypothetical protein